MLEFTLKSNGKSIAITSHMVSAVVEVENGTHIVVNCEDVYAVSDDYASVVSRIKKDCYDYNC